MPSRRSDRVRFVERPPEEPENPAPAPAAPPPLAGAPAPPPPPPPPQYAGQVPPGGWQQPVQHPQGYGAPFADWWPRVGAWLIDVLIVSVPASLIVFIGLAGALSTGGNDFAVGAFVVSGLLAGLAFLVVGVAYFGLTMQREGERNGQTWGKQAVGIRVVRTSGEPMDFGWGTLRDPVVQFGGFYLLASAVTLLFPIAWIVDVLWPLWDDENRALHDMICGTRVIKA